MLVNSKQKIAVLASGLAIASTGFVTDAGAASAGDNPAAGADQSARLVLVPPAEKK
jgi:hypothetical protein